MVFLFSKGNSKWKWNFALFAGGHDLISVAIDRNLPEHETNIMDGFQGKEWCSMVIGFVKFGKNCHFA